MKKLFLSLLFVLTVFLLIFVTKAETTAKKLKIHFYTYGDNQTKFHAWLWQDKPSPTGGTDNKFTHNDDKWATVEVSLTDDQVDGAVNNLKGATKVGIIIKSNSGWGGVTRQPGGDRFIDISEYTDSTGVANAYFVFSDATIYKSKQEAKTDDKALVSYLKEDKKAIVVNATTKPDSASLLDKTGQEIQTWDSIAGKNFELPLSANYELGNKYELKLKFGEKYSTSSISIEKLYTSEEFNQAFYYDGKLGLSYTKEVSTFKVWSPFKKQIQLFLYNQNHEDYDNKGNLNKEEKPYKVVDFVKGEKGVWSASVSEDLDGKYYTYNVISPDGSQKEIVDPYAIAVGVNGTRALVVDIDAIKPENWTGKKPDTIKTLSDYIFYEAHVRDFTTHETWNGKDEWRGTFKGFVQKGTTYTDPKSKLTVKTGFDHILQLGVNAVHLLPIGDANQVDETRLTDKEYMSKSGFNWNYMTNNFNVPDGAYSTNPFDGKQRILEFKELVQQFSDNNLRVVLDVVYNHTGRSDDSNFNTLVDGYYYRRSVDGAFWNDSYTGNDTASERPMFRKFMKDSIKFWAEKYNVSGFRFDIMGIHDVETMNQIREVVDQIDPTIALYGEPWEQSKFEPRPSSDWAVLRNIQKVKNIGMFNPDTRDTIKFNLVSNDYYDQEKSDKILYGIWGGVKVKDDLKAPIPSSENPVNIVNYVSAHDDATLRDFFYSGEKNSPRYANDNDIVPRVKMANAVVLTSQGLPFLHAGSEILRSKPEVLGLNESDNRVHNGTVHNSYNAPDAVNQLRWDNKVKHFDVFNYYRSLIAIRRLYPQFRLNTAAEIRERVEVLEVERNNKNFIHFRIKEKDDQPEVRVIHAGINAANIITLDKDYLVLAYNKNNNSSKVISPFGVRNYKANSQLAILPLTTVILVENKSGIQAAENRTIDFSTSTFKDGNLYNAKIVNMYKEKDMEPDTLLSETLENPWNGTPYNPNTDISPIQPNPGTDTPKASSKGLSKGAIAGISIGVILLIAAISGATFVVLKKKR